MKYRIILEPQPDGGHEACVPALPRCISEGDNRTQAVANIRGAIALHRESLAARKPVGARG